MENWAVAPRGSSTTRSKSASPSQVRRMKRSRASASGRRASRASASSPAPLLAERLRQLLGLLAGLDRRRYSSLPGQPSERSRSIDVGHPLRVLGLLGQVDRHHQRLGAVRDLGRPPRRAAGRRGRSSPCRNSWSATLTRWFGFCVLWAQVGRVVERRLDVLGLALVLLDRQRVAPRTSRARDSSGDASGSPGGPPGRRRTSCCDSAAVTFSRSCAGRLVVLAVVVRPVPTDRRVRTAGRGGGRAGRDRDQRPARSAAGLAGSDRGSDFAARASPT